MKRCGSCGVSKPNTAYSKKKSQNTGKYSLSSYCKECCTDVQTKRYQEMTPEQKLRKKERFMIRVYGISMAEYNQLFAAQEGRCRACRKHQGDLDKSLVIDHDHQTKIVRGLLCSGCNLALGNVKENITALVGLIEYIKGFQP